MDADPIEVQKALKGISYPASKDDLVEQAENNGADDDLVEVLRNMEGTDFDGPTDVEAALD